MEREYWKFPTKMHQESCRTMDLNTYLESRKMLNIELCLLLKENCGIVVSAGTITNYRKGRKLPKLTIANAIQIVTNHLVTTFDLEEYWRKMNRKNNG